MRKKIIFFIFLFSFFIPLQLHAQQGYLVFSSDISSLPQDAYEVYVNQQYKGSFGILSKKDFSGKPYGLKKNWHIAVPAIAGPNDVMLRNPNGKEWKAQIEVFSGQSSTVYLQRWKEEEVDRDEEKFIPQEKRIEYINEKILSTSGEQSAFKEQLNRRREIGSSYDALATRILTGKLRRAYLLFINGKVSSKTSVHEKKFLPEPRLVLNPGAGSFSSNLLLPPSAFQTLLQSYNQYFGNGILEMVILPLPSDNYIISLDGQQRLTGTRGKDGKKIFRRSLSKGTHQITIENQNGKKKNYQVNIQGGQSVTQIIFDGKLL